MLDVRCERSAAHGHGGDPVATYTTALKWPVLRKEPNASKRRKSPMPNECGRKACSAV